MKTNNSSVGSGGFTSELEENYLEYARSIRNMADTTLEELPTYVARILKGLHINDSADLGEQLTFGTVNRFISDYSGDYGAGSCNWMKFVLRSFLKYCSLYELINRDLSPGVPPVHHRKLSSIPKYLEQDTIRKLIESITGNSRSDLRDRAMILLLVSYGIRSIQLRRLCLADIDWQKENICFPAAKNGRIIRMPILPEVGNALADYLHKGRQDSPYPEVFLTLANPVHPLKRSSSVSYIISHRLKRAGLELPEGVSHGAHGFRHAFAVRFAGNIPFKYLSDMLGHCDPSSTLIYSKVAFTELNEAAVPWPEEES